MGLETATYINGLVATNPVGGDLISSGDDHIRLLKATIKATFPNLTGAVNATQAELNYVVGVTSGIQSQLNLKSAIGHHHAETDIQDGNTFPRISANETITGIWNFNLRPNIAGIPILDASSNVLEEKITDGALLARVGSNETIVGNWNFSTAPLIGGLGTFRWGTGGLTSGRVFLVSAIPAETGTPGDIYFVTA